MHAGRPAPSHAQVEKEVTGLNVDIPHFPVQKLPVMDTVMTAFHNLNEWNCKVTRS